MTLSNKLILALSNSSRHGAGIHSTRELAYMLGTQATPSFTKFLADCVKKGLLRRLVSGVFESVISPPDPTGALYRIVDKMRPDAFCYITQESQLSYLGVISQVMFDRVTLMTRGKGGVFKTPYGTIELTHTKKGLAKIMDGVYFDSEIAMYRAHEALAVEDLKRSGRNTDMLAV